MKPFHRMGRRKFLRNSGLGLGVVPLIPSPSTPDQAEESSGRPATKLTGLRMQSARGTQPAIWIVREPTTGFQEQWASREVARGLRSLGLTHDPVQMVAGQGELSLVRSCL